MIDYSLWEVILNGNKVLKRTVGEVEQEYEPTSAEEKQDMRNEMKARGTLLMALPNKDQLKFHSYKDAKLLMEAIEKRYGGNKESKKVQRTLLKQQYKNFVGSSSETIDQTFDRIQKLISQLEIQGEVITQEDMNLKLLRSLSSEWKTHALIWRNKEEIKTITLTATATAAQMKQITTYGVSAAHTQCNPTSGDNLSDDRICAFLASQPNSPQLAREDLEQIDPDNLEEIDLQWEMGMLTIRARRFIKRIGRKLDVNGQIVRFDRSQVECYNCHKNGHFARECRAPRNQENRGRERRIVTVETPTENALVAQDGIIGATHGRRSTRKKGVIDSGCSMHITGNKCYLTEYEDYDGGFVSFRDGKGRISGKGKIKIGTLDFDNVYFCKEIKYNLFSVSQIYDKKNNVLFTDTKCLVLSSDFKLLDESQVLLRVPRKDNIYSVDLKSVVPTKGLTCLFAKAIIDESNLWHRRLGHINFKNMNKLVRGNLVRGLPSKIFENDHSCVACQKGKQHKASCKAKLVNSISKPLHMLHMDLFGPTNVKSLMKKSYCLVVTDDFSRFSWVFFLATKDETSGILKTFITEIENQLDYKVKVIRSDNGTEFKNSVMNQFCEMKGIKREFSVARTPQQNGVAERRNRTLIEAARTMLVDSKLPTTFWAEVVNTACYVLNRVLVIKPHTKTPYELIHGRTLLIDFMKPFGCPVTILNTRDHLGKFDRKADEGFFVGYSVVSKAIRVFNKRTRIVEETLNIRFLENAPNVT
ncbi:putative ribonuclease H-like domain-containing protein [Tanacetum coccineum]